jgi:hypothetical protein
MFTKSALNVPCGVFSAECALNLPLMCPNRALLNVPLTFPESSLLNALNVP